STRLAVTRDAGLADLRVELPLELRVQGAYLDGAWGAIAELEEGAPGKSASAGLERRWSAIQLRGGARLVNRVILPSAGVSIRAGGMWVDIGAAMSIANIERNRNISLATSLRFVRRGARVPSSPVN